MSRKVGFEHGVRTQVFENGEEAMLRLRPFGCSAQFGEFRFEAVGAQRLTAALNRA
jgi:hypothetical protein